jgi:Flp pilus assembly protein TadD
MGEGYRFNAGWTLGRVGILAAALACFGLAGCAQIGADTSQLASASLPDNKGAAAPDTRTDLEKATDYWGKEYAKNPRDPAAALSYARNLKAMGEKRQALAVLQQASVFHGADRRINGEYGRLALELDQVGIAQKLLEQADDPANPDWRVISARGTALAKQGKYRDAIPFYERALTLAPDQGSILNNLALAHAMEGNADKAEPLLKRAAAGGQDARVSQNLALVLGLQGKYDEATLAAARDVPADNAAANVAYVRSMVKIDPQPLTAPAKIAASQPAKPEAPPRLKGTAATDTAAEPAATGWSTHVATTR